MNYKIIKLHFNTAVHFGENNLSDTNIGFTSDTLFSAICIEKIKEMGSDKIEEFVDIFRNKNILFSDAFPYIEDEFYLPKPIIHIDGKNEASSSINKKAYKKMTYINVNDIDKYFLGEFLSPDDTNTKLKKLGKKDVLTRVSIDGEETRPYQLGVYRFKKEAGLYVIIAYNDEKVLQDIINLITNVGIIGIGGKRNSGLGKFTIDVIDEKNGKISALLKKLNVDKGLYMSLSISLPKDVEMENALTNATYSIIRKGGFVDNIYTNIEKIKKKELYLFKSGSCFSNKYDGDIYNISFDENSKVYRYALPLWIGV